MVVEDVFTLWWEGREGLIDRRALGAKWEPLVEELRAALESGSGCADAKVVAVCDNLLALSPALWLFAGIEGVEPTNNHAERLLMYGGGTSSSYNHVMVMPPNTWSCAWDRDGGAFNASSRHPGTINVLFADGSTRNLKSSVAKQVWSALGTRSHNDVVSASDY